MTPADLAALCDRSYTAPTVQLDNNVGILIEGGALAIRGTRIRVLADVLRDADIETIDDPVLGPVHRGCLEAANAIAAWLVETRRSDWPRIICGHSLGGGIAGLLGAIYAVAGCPLDQITTFGSMAACKGGTVTAISASVPVRDCFWHAGDPVPCLPPGFNLWHSTPAVIGTAAVWPIENHYIETYQAALAAPVTTAPGAIPATA